MVVAVGGRAKRGGSKGREEGESKGEGREETIFITPITAQARV